MDTGDNRSGLTTVLSPKASTITMPDVATTFLHLQTCINCFLLLCITCLCMNIPQLAPSVNGVNSNYYDQ